jgi:hypothetical protein
MDSMRRDVAAAVGSKFMTPNPIKGGKQGAAPYNTPHTNNGGTIPGKQLVHDGMFNSNITSSLTKQQNAPYFHERNNQSKASGGHSANKRFS